MNIRLVCSLAAAALLPALATETYARDVETEETPISLMGCVQRETDYRRQNNAGRGGFLGFGGGLGDEYVLVNASPGAEGAFGDCTTATGGEAYELTGSAEDDLEPFVGQRVAISGMRKAADIDVATGQPTGGRPVGDDLRLFEVDVDSFRAFAPPVATRTMARLHDEPSPVQQDQQRIDNDRGAPDDSDADAARELPQTASSLGLTAVMGLLSLAGGFTLRTVRRRS